MKYLRKPWLRLIISLIGGGMVMELLHITTRDANRIVRPNFSWVLGVIIYAGISFYIRLVDWRRSKDMG